SRERCWRCWSAGRAVGTMLLRPIASASHGLAPARIETLALASWHLRGECTVQRPVGGQILLIAPEANSETGEVGGAQRCSLSHSRTLHRDAKLVRLELHELVVHRRTAIHP